MQYLFLNAKMWNKCRKRTEKCRNIEKCVDAKMWNLCRETAVHCDWSGRGNHDPRPDSTPSTGRSRGRGMLEPHSLAAVTAAEALKTDARHVTAAEEEAYDAVRGGAAKRMAGAICARKALVMLPGTRSAVAPLWGAMTHFP